ncbi:cytochrome P450 [Sporothrix schenckii 1099-18]|uniref:Cytochrome P450 n=2 Tax=Sporothrix schenckii TaxID=29908 RepID=U7PIE3_SPOS1|nr:cytochrome P450 [Sporothrix schenckii 1099-18]ERS95312.1 hypothetical protein HMPREF1624_08190 [Sporothrix schenckii ATCC 58251]KJR87579.1 cytochrome P450 [Sporothrix schenckii 1099-18]
MSPILHASLLLLLVTGFVRLLMVGRRPKNYPPGPPTIPILGNIHLMPKRDLHLQLRKWADQYGPVFSLILGTQTLIVLSSDQAVKDLLDKKSNIYSDRPELYVGQTLASGGLRLLMMGYGQTWRGFRKLFHSLLNVAASKAYLTYQVLENKQMLYDLTQTPEDFLCHIRRYSNALTTTMVFGWRTPTYQDDKLMQLFDGFAEFADLNQTGAAALLDAFPLLRNLPEALNPTRRLAKTLHAKEKALYLSHWLKAKDEIRKGTIAPCFCVGLAEAQKKEGFSDDQACYISGTLLEAGSDTTSSTIYAFVQAMLLYPAIQKKAQAIVDAVVGDARLPTMDDDADLQYVRAIMKETIRWMPTTILGAVPHAASADDSYNGYLIPKGAGVLNNVWGINMDATRHPAPRRFDPDRYLDDRQSLGEAAANPDAAKRDQFTFGAGRRICPGIHVAERSLFLAMSRILWGFDITPALDASGQPDLPDQEKLTQGFVCMPQEFRATIRPRSEARKQLIEAEWEAAQTENLDPVTKQWKDNYMDKSWTLKT